MNLIFDVFTEITLLLLMAAAISALAVSLRQPLMIDNPCDSDARLSALISRQGVNYVNR